MTNSNSVNPDNFNETMKGYLKRAFKIVDIPKQDQKKILNGLRWATSEMTMEEARQEFYND